MKATKQLTTSSSGGGKAHTQATKPKIIIYQTLLNINEQNLIL